MASTKLLRKARRNKSKARENRQELKRLTFQPVIKKVDVEELKKEFAPAKPAAKKKAQEEEVKESAAE